MYPKKGDQVWNEDHTRGYEFLSDVLPNTPIQCELIKALGDAERPKPGNLMEKWFAEIMLKPGGYAAYKAKLSQTDK